MDSSSDFTFGFRVWIDQIINCSWWRETKKTIQLRDDFQKTFSTPDGKRVLHYLSHFCRANHSCWSESEREHSLLEGRRDVFLEIMNWCQISEETLLQYRREQFDDFDKELEIKEGK